MPPAANLRLTIDTAALADNWRRLDRASGPAMCGAAVKADGYGLGADKVARILAAAGCREFLVSSWAEAAELHLPEGCRLAMLHGVQDGEMATALASTAVPVLCTAAQVAAWRAAAPGRPCDIMVDTGMNRLGLAMEDLDSLDGLVIDTVHSHLACADTPVHPLNARQLTAFQMVVGRTQAKRASLANSSGIMLGTDYAFGLTRPGIGLYGGGISGVAPVAGIEARVVQVREVAAGGTVGYGATWTAALSSRIAILNLGYADGYPRALSNAGFVFEDALKLPVVGRVSMDLVALDVTGTGIAEGDWLSADFDLARVAAAAGISQYELLTGLGHRYARVYQ